jgi:class 3 adenylate cyclase
MLTLEMALELDIRAVLPTIQVPTLVLHRAEVDFVRPEAARWAADQIPHARYVELPGRDPFPLVGDADAVLDEIELFVTGELGTPDVHRRMATLVFTDVVGSTELAGRLGDRRWGELLDTHRSEVRRLLRRFDGREIDTAGDGFFAVFDGAARAIRCTSAILDAMPPLGVELRAGIHAGEIEQRDDAATGMAVHIAARVAAAQGGEILVTRTVTDLVIGSGIEFIARGRHRLKGVAEEWDLFAVASIP